MLLTLKHSFSGVWLDGKDLLPLVFLILGSVFLIYQLEPELFGTSTNFNNLLRNVMIFSVIASAQMFVMMSGGFDLSVGAIAAFSSVITGLGMVWLEQSGIHSEFVIITLGVAFALLCGMLVGLFNGLVVAYMHASSLIVTFGTLSIVGGGSFYLTAGTPIYGLPDKFVTDFAFFRVFGISSIVIVCSFVLISVWFIQNRFSFGSHLRAVGGNQDAAGLAGINTRRIIVTAHMLSGLLSALVGILLTARLGSGQPTAGLDLMLTSIAVCVIGGVTLGGGHGRVGKVVCAALFLGVVFNGMNLLRLDSRYQLAVLGFIIIIATVIEHRLAGKK